MSDAPQTAPTLLFVVGPPAVGKMTVGSAIAERTGFRMLHNHQTIDLVLPYFPFGSPPFRRLVSEFRRRLLQEIADSTLPGLVFTYVWAFNDPRDQEAVDTYAAPFRERGGRVLFLELEATQAERLQRNAHPDRLTAKPFKRDLTASHAQLIDFDVRYTLNSGGRFDDMPGYLRLDNTKLSPAAVAEHVITAFALPRLAPDGETAGSPPQFRRDEHTPRGKDEIPDLA